MVSPIGPMYGIYANIGGILMVNVTIYSMHGSYGFSYLILTSTLQFRGQTLGAVHSWAGTEPEISETNRETEPGHGCLKPLVGK